MFDLVLIYRSLDTIIGVVDEGMEYEFEKQLSIIFHFCMGENRGLGKMVQNLEIFSLLCFEYEGGRYDMLDVMT